MVKVFGKKPKGSRLERVKNSPNYKDGSFQNLSHTEVTLKDTSMLKMMREYSNKPKDTTPPHPIPAIKTDLKNIETDTPAIVWFGHSSYFIKSKNTNILVDPVFSGYASPVPLFAKAFPSTHTYTTNDFDAIDILIITHDHYDHLDYVTIKKLAPNIKKIYTSLGVGSHLEYWGIPSEKITELDWWEEASPESEIKITAAPARHFSGRGIKRAQTLWSSFILNIHNYNIYLGADSGYDSHFKTIGERFKPFDIALLECGQYGKNWPYIHMTPEQTLQAAHDINTKVLMPVHWAKFTLALHTWNEPIKRLLAAEQEKPIQITTPQIGEPVILNTTYPNTKWWEL